MRFGVEAMCFSIAFQVRQGGRTLNYPEYGRRVVQAMEAAWTGKGDPDGDTCIVMYGGGVTSYEAARRTLERFGPDRTEVWFADTNIEDQDLYRFNRQVQDLLGIRFERFSNNNDTIWDVFGSEPLATRASIRVRSTSSGSRCAKPSMPDIPSSSVARAAGLAKILRC